jgi:hypothetical protein
MSEMVGIRTGVGAEADFLKSDNMSLRVVFYDEKQFINQGHKAANRQSLELPFHGMCKHILKLVYIVD